jgi:hypothetical protein
MFSSIERHTKHESIQYWLDYVFHKQTVRELAQTHNKDRRTIKTRLDTVQLPEKRHNPRSIHLLADATYFGERTEESSWCVVVFRDFYGQEDLWWTFVDTETTSVYRTGRDYLESLGYTILRVTADGFGGIKQAFSGIPYQMCHVHMERMLRKGTTRNPKTEAGQALRALTLSLFDTDGDTFKRRYQQYLNLYTPFLNQKTVNPETGRTEWTHGRLRTASLSLIHHLPFLFTYEDNIRIPKDTNALEAHFRHINEVTAVHCGLSRTQKEKFISTILLTSTIAPSPSLLKRIFKI